MILKALLYKVAHVATSMFRIRGPANYVFLFLQIYIGY